MSLRDIADVLADRAAHAGVALPEPLADRLTVYYQLLAHWNEKINLTSLSDPDEAVDRLLLEPVAAAAHLPPVGSLVDLGSGGGSPAVPLALTLRVSHLVMVESRGRKAAFLRELLRELALPGVVESDRFESVCRRDIYQEQFDLISVRAVRLDASTLECVGLFLRAGGRAALFRGPDATDQLALPPSLRWEQTVGLIPASRSALTVLVHK
jgi:16S rRNA (guanine527-N7)-methyltransferase